MPRIKGHNDIFERERVTPTRASFDPERATRLRLQRQMPIPEGNYSKSELEAAGINLGGYHPKHPDAVQMPEWHEQEATYPDYFNLREAHLKHDFDAPDYRFHDYVSDPDYARQLRDMQHDAVQEGLLPIPIPTDPKLALEQVSQSHFMGDIQHEIDRQIHVNATLRAQIAARFLDYHKHRALGRNLVTHFKHQIHQKREKIKRDIHKKHLETRRKKKEAGDFHEDLLAKATHKKLD